MNYEQLGISRVDDPDGSSTEQGGNLRVLQIIGALDAADPGEQAKGSGRLRSARFINEESSSSDGRVKIA